MKQHTNAILAVATALLLGGSVLAQQPTRDKPAQAAPEKPMAMGDMMKGCQEHCQATTKSIDQLTRTIDEAKASNDPATMRAALDQAGKPLADETAHDDVHEDDGKHARQVKTRGVSRRMAPDSRRRPRR